MLFAMLFANFTSYIGARTAVEQATKRASRCVTPTDSEDCLSLTAPSADHSLNWYGHNITQSEELFVDKRNYEANLYRQPFRATYYGALRHEVQPIVNYTTHDVRLRRFTPQMNQYENRYGRLIACGLDFPATDFTPIGDPNFPAFKQSYESAMTTQPGANWQPYEFCEGGPGCNLGVRAIELTPFFENMIEVNLLRPPSDTPGDGLEGVYLGSFVIPTLPGVNDESECTGAACENPDAINPNWPESWKTHGRVALKMDMRFRRTSTNYDNTFVRWGDANRWGLRLAVTHPDGSIRNICLGGAAAQGTSQTSGWAHSNMWLRGPRGSNGGTSAVCTNPDGTDDLDHSNIAILRGSTVSIIARVKVLRNEPGSTRPTDNALVRLNARAYIDQYQEPPTLEPPIPVCNECDPVQFSPSAGFVSQVSGTPITSIHDSSCGVAAGVVPAALNPPQYALAKAAISNPPAFEQLGWTPGGFASLESSRSPSCTSGPHSFDIGSLAAGCSETYGVCENELSSFQPSSYCADAPVGRLLCGFSVANAGTVRVGRKPASCTAAETDNITNSSCGTVLFQPNGNYGNAVNECSGLQTEVAATEGGASMVNRPGFHPLTPASFNWGDVQEPNHTGYNTNYPNENWRFYWELPAGGSVAALPTCSNATRTECKLTLSDSVSGSDAPYQRIDGAFPQDVDPASYFTPRGPDGSTAPQHIASNPVSIVRDGEPTAEPITAGYPFDVNPANELARANGEEFTNCPEGYDPTASLAERLRYFAGRSNPQALDPELRFTATESELIDSTQIALGEFSDLTLDEQCTAPQHVFYEVEDAPELIGTFLRSEYPAGPPQCSDYDRCSSEFAEVITEQEEAPELIANLDRVRERAYLEVERAFPTARRDCAEPGCTEVAIDLDTGYLARVTTTYHLPLTFPLDTIWDSDSLPVSFTKEEAIELKLLARMGVSG